VSPSPGRYQLTLLQQQPFVPFLQVLSLSYLPKSVLSREVKMWIESS